LVNLTASGKKIGAKLSNLVFVASKSRSKVSYELSRMQIAINGLVPLLLPIANGTSCTVSFKIRSVVSRFGDFLSIRSLFSEIYVKYFVLPSMEAS